ncbi:VRR-NUC domain-containing protein [Fibrella aestuarina]|uniref:VRR-NUC domain-containing protein n=2 Tax=Fibrivirga algicola TaxID=2950420 RepID=A0ABX0QKJ1_9BACT|nr:VRR-NUC domain-containing protein [Fibrivirga algicola]
MNGLHQLSMLADTVKQKKYPNFPAHALIKARYRDKTANDLTTAIVDWLKLQGEGNGFGTRLQSTGTFREDLGKFVPSRQRRGMPDVFGIVDGIAYFVEVKVGNDKLSADQLETIDKLKQAGARVFVAENFQAFFEWWNEQTAVSFT